MRKAITGRKWCDYFVQSKLGHVINHIYYDESFSTSLLATCHCFKSHIIPSFCNYLSYFYENIKLLAIFNGSYVSLLLTFKLCYVPFLLFLLFYADRSRTFINS